MRNWFSKQLEQINPQKAVFRTLALSCGLFALYFVGIYLYIALNRIHYPFELEWMEGGAVDHVQRILNGYKLYAEPSPDFVPYIYPPLFFYASAFVAKIVSLSYLPLRLVSFTASLGLLILLVLWGKKETGKILYGIISAGFYAATFELSGSWFDIGRIDSLYIFLLAIGLYLVRFGKQVPSAIMAGFFLTLAWLTKQTALAAIPPALLCLWITQPKRGFYFLASAGLLSVGAFLVMNHYYEGWFYYYLFEVPRGHALYTNLFSYFWRYDLVGPAAIACSFSLIFLITNIFEKDTLKKAFYFFIPAALLTISAASRIHSEAYSNVLFPAYAALAIMTPMALKRILSDRTRTAGLRLGPWLGLILMLAQFYQLYYPAARHMPTAYDLAAGQRLIRVIQSIPGDVLIPYHGFLSTQSGKSPSAQAMGVYDVLRSPDHAGACLIDAYRQQILSKKYEAVILDDSESFLTFGNELKKLYGKKIPLFRMETVFRPRTGSYFRPVNIVFLKGSESEAKIKALLNQPISLTDIESHPR